MGKNKNKAALKKIFKDITNLAEEVIHDSKKFQKRIKRCDFDDKVVTNKVIEDGKIIIERLKVDVVKITECFDETYNAWQGTIEEVNDKESKDTEASAIEINLSNVNDVDHAVVTSDEHNDGADNSVNNTDVSNEISNVANGQNECVSDEVSDTAETMNINSNTTKDSGLPKIAETNTVDDDNDTEIGDVDPFEENCSADVSAGIDMNDASDVAKNLENDCTEEVPADIEKNHVNDVAKNFEKNCVNVSADLEMNDMNDVSKNLEKNSAADILPNVEMNNVDDAKNLEKNSVNGVSEDLETNDLNDVASVISTNVDNNVNEDENETNQDTDSMVDEVKKEPKIFLKCIDINKLKSLPNSGANDSVLIISDSEPEKDEDAHMRKSLRKKNQNGTIDAIALGIGQEITISKIRKPGDKDDVQIIENDNISRVNSRTTSTKSNVASATGSKKRVKDSLKISEHLNTDSSSDSDVSHKRKQLKRLMRKLPKPSKHELRMIDALKDKKFGYKAYVPLPRYPCEKLKELYLEKIEDNLLKRLSNLNNLKKRKHDKCKGSDSSSSDKRTKKGKSKRTASKESDSSEISDSDSSDGAAKKNLHSTEFNADPNTIILNDVSSATDASASEDNKSKKKKQKSKKSKKKKSSDEDSYDKKKWRNDKLLKKKFIDSDSDSEDEDSKSKRKKEKSKNRLKSRLAKKKAKKVIDSSSESDPKKKSNKKKKQAESSSESSSSSSSSSDSDSDKRPKKETTKPKKGGRIKRTKGSSSSDDDDDKTTRKSIRRVKGHEELRETTKQAEKEELERKARIAERQKKYNAIFDADKPEDSTVDKVVLDFDENSKNELLSVEKKLVTKLKPHQVKGIQFMWDACYESIARTKKTSGSGCILAHCMGLGKTLQVITLIHTLITNKEETNVEKVLVVCPVNTVLNWVEEFQKWLNDLDGDTIEVYELVSNKQNSYREHLVKEWRNHGGVLIIGYDMFRNLTNPTNKRLHKRMRESFQTGMINPGPDLIICDEGHLLKNEKTNLNVAISRVRTERRIVLTGTPMQNNLKEYYCMVQFVKPNLLGTYKEYLNRFVNPITNGQYTDSTARDISVMKKRSHVLHKMLDGIVQRMDYNVLAPFLPPKYEYVLFTKLSDIQIQLYQYYLDNLARRPVDSKIRKTAFLFSDFQEFQRICTHPRALLLKSIEDRKKAIFEESDESEGSLKDFIDDKSEKSTSSSSTSSSSDSDSENSNASKNKKSKDGNMKSHKSNKRMTRTAAAAAGVDVGDIIDDIVNDKDELNNWWKQIVDGNELENIVLGEKLYLLFEILKQCELIGDKILIFSQSLYSLNIIEYFLSKIDQATQDDKVETVSGFSGSWALGLDYFRIDGSSSCDNRAAWCKSFNNLDNLRARLFLISTKAGGLGINLVGANRVIIFDVSWNPSHDIQSIYRVYRFGQIKPCYIYRFVSWGTMEMKIYERQVTKQAISKRVIDEQQIDRHYNQNDLAELYNFDPTPTEAPTPLLPKDVLLAELLQTEKDRIYKYHEHQSLLENKEEEELDEAERKAAWEEYEHEKTNPPASTAGIAAAGGWIKNLPLTSIQVALLNIVQRDNPTWTREQVQAVIPIVIQQLREQVEQGEQLLFNRVVNELRVIQTQQQQKLQQYYVQQQLRMLKQQKQLFAGAVQKQHTAAGKQPTAAGNIQNSRPLINPNEIVELND